MLLNPRDLLPQLVLFWERNADFLKAMDIQTDLAKAPIHLRFQAFDLIVHRIETLRHGSRERLNLLFDLGHRYGKYIPARADAAIFSLVGFRT